MGSNGGRMFGQGSSATSTERGRDCHPSRNEGRRLRFAANSFWPGVNARGSTSRAATETEENRTRPGGVRGGDVSDRNWSVRCYPFWCWLQSYWADSESTP